MKQLKLYTVEWSKEAREKTCIDTGKSSTKSGGKNKSACFFVNEGLPDEKFQDQYPRSSEKAPRNNIAE